MSKSDMVYRYTASKIEYLHSIADTGRGKGYLAELRHGIGKKPGELPSLWWLIFDRIDEELKGSKCASNAEWAVYTALTLYSLHQQGNDRFMYEKGYTLGRAAYHIANSNDDEERVVNRLNLVVTSTTKEELAYQLKSIVQLLKGKSIPLDYAKLSEELYRFNYPEQAADIKLSWGRDFYSEKYKTEKDNSKGE